MREAKRLGIKCIAICEEHGIPFYLAIGTSFLALSRIRTGRDPAQLEELRRGAKILDDMGCRITVSSWKAREAEALLTLQLLEEGLETVQQSLDISRDALDRVFLAAAHRTRGELLLAQGDADAGEGSLRTALEVSRGQGARLFELRAATSIARRLAGRDDYDAARAILQPVYSELPECVDSSHFREARELLAELG